MARSTVRRVSGHACSPLAGLQLHRSWGCPCDPWARLTAPLCQPWLRRDKVPEVAERRGYYSRWQHQQHRPLPSMVAQLFSWLQGLKLPSPVSGLLGGPADSGSLEPSASPPLHWRQTGQVSGGGGGETGAGRGSTTLIHKAQERCCLEPLGGETNFTVRLRETERKTRQGAGERNRKGKTEERETHRN